MSKNLNKLISSREATVAVVGLGYVGLPLSLSFAAAGFKVTGIDIAKEKISLLKEGRSYIDDISDEELQQAIASKKFKSTDKFKKIEEADCVIICVPTPLSKTKEPDLSYVLNAIDLIAPYTKKGHLIVLESTTFPGTTDEVIAPRIESGTGLQIGSDILLGFSPERVDPANRQFKIKEIPKVVGGIDSKSKQSASLLYGQVFDRVVEVSSTKTAEMVKLLENTFRSINIGLINEMAMICDTLDVDVWEVIQAASTKPFGFMPFYPGPGIGGHCINIDSMYLAWKARLHGYEPRLIELAQTINDSMPALVLDKAFRILNDRKKAVNGSNVLILGVAYKRNVSDTRESPAGAIISGLITRGAKVKYIDPYVPEYKVTESLRLKSVLKTDDAASKADLIVIVTDHDEFEYEKLTGFKVPILDTRNAMKYCNRNRNLIHKL